VDLAFFCIVVHHIRDRDGYFRGLVWVLRAGVWGAVVVFR
jgi:hypothetical protein